jgi:hypothetical protein
MNGRSTLEIREARLSFTRKSQPIAGPPPGRKCSPAHRRIEGDTAHFFDGHVLGIRSGAPRLRRRRHQRGEILRLRRGCSNWRLAPHMMRCTTGKLARRIASCERLGLFSSPLLPTRTTFGYTPCSVLIDKVETSRWLHLDSVGGESGSSEPFNPPSHAGGHEYCPLFLVKTT